MLSTYCVMFAMLTVIVQVFGGTMSAPATFHSNPVTVMGPKSKAVTPVWLRSTIDYLISVYFTNVLNNTCKLKMTPWKLGHI